MTSRNGAVGRRRAPAAPQPRRSLPPLPLDPEHWEAIFRALDLSAQQSTVVELVLRDQSVKQIARIMEITEPTVKTYLARIATRTGARGRMQLAMHVLAVSHQVSRNGHSPG